MSLSLERLIRPRSIAIVGASEKVGALGASVLANLERARFQGAIHLINPRRVEIGGRRCVASVDDLPEGIDVAVLAIPRAAVLDAVRGLASRKAGAAIIFSAGFAETGAEGLAEQRELARIAVEADMAIEGPNCLGLVNFVDGVPLTFVELPGDRLGARPGVGLVSQSGAMAAVLAVTLASRGLGLSYSISTGNEAASGVEDYVDYLVDDPDTRVIAMIVELFRKPARFLAAAARAAAAGKPIVLLHPGRSRAARESAMTHTGALTGDYDIMRLKVERAGVLLVETLEELGDVAEMLLRSPAPTPGGVAVVCESGAYKALTLDLAEREGLPLSPLSDADSPGLRASLPDFVPVSNPLDVTAQGLVDPDLYARVLAALIADDRVRSVLLAIIQTDAVTAKLKFPPILAAIEKLRPSKRVVFAGLDEGAAVPPEYVERLRALNIAYFPSSDRAVRALARLGRWKGALSASPIPQRTKTAAFAGVAGMIPEWRAKAALASIGIPFPQGALATTFAEAAAIAARIGYPVAINQPMTELGWKSLGMLELTALPSIDRERWVSWVREADVLLVNGGDALYLCHWMRQSGLAGLIPSLHETVWVGFSAGSMVLTPRIGADFVGWKPPAGDDSTLGIVDFSIFPHVDHPALPDNTMAAAERWAATLGNPAYAIDDETAIKVTGGAVELVSEGHWKLLTPDSQRQHQSR